MSFTRRAVAVASQDQKALSNIRPPQKSEDLDFRVLRFVEENPDRSQREISRALGLSLGGVNYCLKALIDKGLIKIENFRTSSNKLGYLYVLTPQGIAQRAALTKAEIEAMQLYVDAGETAEEVGKQ